MSRRPIRLVSLLTCMAVAGAFAGSACGDTFNCGDTFECEDETNGGAGGERMSSEDEAGGAGGEGDGVLVCAKDTFDCNDDAKDGCEVKAKSLTVPSRPESRRPLRSAYTGSLHARKTAATLRPTFAWSESEVEDGCGQLHYEIEVDDSCKPGELTECEFDSPEVKAESQEATFTPTKDLPVSEVAPVGAFYTWRVRACDEANCSDWSDPAPLNVGRTLQDLNGDGYADAMAVFDTGTEIYLGGAFLSKESSVRLALGDTPRFVGDLNGDGFADLALRASTPEECDFEGRIIYTVFGAATPEAFATQAHCSAGGPASVAIQPRDVGDLNGDGFDDLAVTRGSADVESSVLVFAGGLEITELLTEPNTIRPIGSSRQAVVGRGDYDGDGFPDLLAGGGSDADTNEIYVLHGGTRLSEEFDLVHRFENCRAVDWMESVGDLNGDELDDWMLNCRGTGDGDLLGVIYGGSDELDELSEFFSTGLPISFISPSLDFDGDGTSEFILGVENATSLIWHYGEPFNDETQLFEGFLGDSSLDVADYNGDARLDLLTSRDFSVLRAAATTSFNVVPTALQLPTEATVFYGIAF